MRFKELLRGVGGGCALAAALLIANPSAASEGGGGGGPREPDATIRPAPRYYYPIVGPRPGRPPARAAVRRPVPRDVAPAPPARAARAVAARPPRAAVARSGGEPPRGETRFVQDEVLALLASGVDPAALAQLEQAQNLTRLGSEPIGVFGATLNRYRVPPGRSTAQAIAALRADQRIAAAQPNYVFVLQQSAGSAGAPIAQYAVDKLRLRKAHETATGAGIAIAVIDSMMDAEHPELKGAVVKRFDAFDTPTTTSDAHGTAIAGLIAAHDKLLGAAPRALIFAVSAFAPNGDKDPASGTSWRIIRGLDWSVGAGARIANLSFAGPEDPLLGRAIAEAYKRGVTMIAAAGNAGPKSPPLYPASDKNVIAVTAIDASDKLYSRASGGKHIAFAAPGVDVLTTGPKGAYDLATGTSMAAAYASGVAALILDKNPKIGPAEILATLRRSTHVAPGGKVTDIRAIDAADALAISVTAIVQPTQ